MLANVYRLHAPKFVHAWHKGVLPELFDHFFQYASNVHNFNIRYAAKQNLHLWQEHPLKHVKAWLKPNSHKIRKTVITLPGFGSIFAKLAA